MAEFAARYGRWAVVTGAAQGVGLACTEALIARGLGVVLVDVDPMVADVARALGDEATARPLIADVADPSWIESLAEATDGLEVGLAVANAGVAFVGRYLDMEPARRRAILEVNCAATADLASWALPAMVERGRGGFVATSSGSALAGTGGVALYSATKAFSINLVEALGWELADSGVDTLAVVAPTMDTPMFRAGGADPARLRRARRSPRRRRGCARRPTRGRPVAGRRGVAVRSSGRPLGAGAHAEPRHHLHVSGGLRTPGSQAGGAQ